MSDTLRHTPSGVFLGHMLAFDHGIHNDTPTGAEHEKALAREIFGGKPEDLLIGDCHGQDWCLWVLAIQALVELMSRRKCHFDLWHVYSRETLNVK